MFFKMFVLGHVLLASAFENKALHELQADTFSENRRHRAHQGAGWQLAYW